MRQFYNTAESPEMVISQIMDTVSVGGATPSAPQAIASQFDEAASGQSSCKNTLRLSLANLLPSRLDNDLNLKFISLYLLW